MKKLFNIQKILTVFLCFACLIYSVHSKLFPYRGLDILNEANVQHREWTSVRDCPIRYYDTAKDSGVAPVAGEIAKEREFAHMAAIGWINGNTVKWNCGGSLISHNVVLTAAHCATFKGKAPDLVKLGDLNLESETDDEKMQQFSIIEIIKHPNFTNNMRYNDIAMLKLNTSVTFDDTVVPACLWTFPNFEFKILEACGYGQVSYQGNTTPQLLKVNLSPYELQLCKEFYPADRKLPDGLSEDHLCAQDVKKEMDTCLGDSGGPLQIKLLTNGRLTPFIVGITSFGRSCAGEPPGVYTKISSYIDWIESELNESFEPTTCSLRYVKYREFEPDLVISINERRKWITYDFTRTHIDVFPTDYEHRVSIGWNDEMSNKACGGVIITEQYVLTSGLCLKSEEKEPTTVFIKDSKAPIHSIIFHPSVQLQDEFTENTLDVALIRLKNLIDFTSGIHPACLWSEPEIPSDLELETTAWGSKKYHSVFLDDPHSQNYELLTVRSSRINETECKKTVPAMSSNHLCNTNDMYLIPDTCSLDIGGPLQRDLFISATSSKSFPFVMGITSFGKECGFGSPIISTKTSSVIDWIDSIIFSETNKSKIKNIIMKREVPNLKAYNESHNFELEDCPHIYERYRVEPEQIYTGADLPVYSHIAFIGDDSLKFPCHGALISNNIILTSYGCLFKNYLSHKFQPTKVSIHNKIFDIEHIVDHEHRVTLLKFKESINLSQKLVPACIWLDKETTPFELTILTPSYQESPETPWIYVKPFQNQFCMQLRNESTGIHDFLTKENYGCLNFIHSKTSCDFSDDRVIVQAVKNINNKQVPYIVGLIDTLIDCEFDKPLIYSRIAYDIAWIRKQLQ